MLELLVLLLSSTLLFVSPFFHIYSFFYVYNINILYFVHFVSVNLIQTKFIVRKCVGNNYDYYSKSH